MTKIPLETDTPSRLLIVAAGALMDRERRVLVQQRPAGKSMAGLWEFPGGKVEPGETPEAALIRELMEELGVAVDAGALRPLSFASDAGEGRPLLLLLYLVCDWSGEPRAIEAAALRWERPEDLGALSMPPADVPLIEALLSHAVAKPVHY